MQGRAGGGFLDRAGVQQLARRQDHFETQDLIPHGTIFAPKIAQTIRGNGASHRGHGNRPRIVPAHQPMRGSRLIELLHGHPGADLCQTVRWTYVDVLEVAESSTIPGMIDAAPPIRPLPPPIGTSGGR